jgi:hypothetical protein
MLPRLSSGRDLGSGDACRAHPLRETRASLTVSHPARLPAGLELLTPVPSRFDRNLPLLIDDRIPPVLTR